MGANFGDPRSRVRELRQKKNTKEPQVLAWKVIKLLIIPKPLDEQNWNLYRMWDLWMLYANWVWGRPVTWPKFYKPKMDKKLTNLNRYISVITNIDKQWFAVFEHTINRLSFGCVRLPQLTTIFFGLRLSFTFFFLFSVSPAAAIHF